MKFISKFFAVMIGLTVIVSEMQPAQAAPIKQLPEFNITSDLTSVHFRRRFHRHGRRNGAILGAIIGGALIGGAIADSNRRERRRVRRSGNRHVNWCYRKYRSYRASDDTFQPFEGGRRYCNSPYN